MKGQARKLLSPGIACVMFISFMGFASINLRAQEPTPETGNTIFPGGGLFSYGADFISKRAPASFTGVPIPATIGPTSEISQPLVFSWGIRRDLELTVETAISSDHLSASELPAPPTVGGSGLGDTLVLLKYRFLRLDSERGTTQASITIGPKLPTGRTNLRDYGGALLPATLQPGSGSTDLFVNFSGTYTGLFHVEKLVADATIDYLRRTEGTQRTQLGDGLHSRFYFPYRPYQSHSVGREWWIGPEVVWQHAMKDRIAGLSQADSGGDVLSLGAATYYSPRPGLELWFGIDFAVAQQMNGVQDHSSRHISVGISKQIQLHR
jgi:hypothetical protein